VVSELLKKPLDLLPDNLHTSVATTIAVIMAFVILSFFHVVMGEIVPKSFTLEHAERVALFVGGPINWFYAVFRPFIWVLVKASGAVLRHAIAAIRTAPSASAGTSGVSRTEVRISSTSMTTPRAAARATSTRRWRPPTRS